MNKKIKFTIIIFSVIITSVILVELLNKNLESVNVNIIQKASEYDSRIFLENIFTEEQICYGKNDDGSKILLECDIPVHGNSPLKYQDEDIRENLLLINDPAVKDCIPKKEGDVYPTMPYRNSTHSFDVGVCKWYERDILQKSEIIPQETVNVASCDPSYPDVCIAVYPPDLNCGHIPYGKFRVIGNDPHGFDRDDDGKDVRVIDLCQMWRAN